MGLKTKKILGIDITISPKHGILEEIQKYFRKVKSQKSKVKSGEIKPLIIYTPNPEIITFAAGNADFARIVNTAQINLPDGAGTVWAIEKLYGMKLEKIPGVDFMLELVKMANRESLRIGLIGGRGGLADITAECLLSRQQNLKIEVLDAPEIRIQNSEFRIQKSEKDTSDGGRLTPLSGGSNDSSEVEELEERYLNQLVHEIIEKRIDILFVALGFPKQEYFINSLTKTNLDDRTNLSSRGIVMMAVGGAFDYISGRIPRAPKWMRNMGWEWLFRLICEPNRILRQLRGAEFFLKILLTS